MKAQPTLLRTMEVFVIAAALALAAAPALAVHNDGTFEIDGDVIPFSIPNATDPTGTPGPDWQTLFNCTTTGCTPTAAGTNASASFILDPAPQSIFTGGGSKDGLNLNQWKWTNGSVPDKDDLTSAFAAVLNDADGDRILYFGADRLANNGDAQIGFWFFQNTVRAVGGVFVDQNGNPATHAVGDILVLSNFTGGGTATNISVFKVTAINPDGSLQFQTLAQGAANTNLACAGDFACAATNNADTPALGAYYTPKFGSQGTYPAESFFEGGLDLTALGLGAECFPGFLVETRSSQSITAVLKDFTLKELQHCQATMTTQVLDATNTDKTNTSVPFNTVLHDTATVTGSIGVATPTGTVTFTFFDNKTCTPPAVPAPSPLSDPVTANLVETTPPTSTTAGIAQASTGTFTLLPGDHCIQATYSGNALYPGTVTSAPEPITVQETTVTINTRILRVSTGGEVTNQALNLANSATVDVQDEVTVTGALGAPTGTVTFHRFANGNCSGTITTDETVTLVPGAGNDSTALSSVYSLGPNTLSYTAIYNGEDSRYLPSQTSSCEPVCALNFLQ